MSRRSFEGTLERAFWICNHLLDGGFITHEILMDRLGLSESSARRWVAAMSRRLPVYEDDKVVSVNSGYPVTTFRLLDI